MKNEHLHLLINEEIYLINEEGSKDADKHSGIPKDDAPDKENPSGEAENEASPEEAPVSPEKIDPGAENNSDTVKTVDTAFVHNSSDKEELELLNNIISACKLKTEDFRVVHQNEKINFKKGVIFTASAAAFYEPVQKEDSLVLFSQPLQVLNNSKEEKGKLWNALKTFF